MSRYRLAEIIAESFVTRTVGETAAAIMAEFDVIEKPKPPPKPKTRGEEVAEKAIVLCNDNCELAFYGRNGFGSGMYIGRPDARSALPLFRENLASLIDSELASQAKSCEAKLKAGEDALLKKSRELDGLKKRVEDAVGRLDGEIEFVGRFADSYGKYEVTSDDEHLAYLKHVSNQLK